MPIPDFIIIGAMKAGTTTLYSNLNIHPEIGMTSEKEAHYFSKKFEKGYNWYSSLYPESKSFYGDVTPDYSWLHIYPETPKNIHSINPNTKLIYIVRDPIERIISHLHHDLYRDRLKYSEISTKLFSNPHYIYTSKYGFQLEGYLNYFDKSQILILDFNSLKDNPKDVINKIYNFIGVINKVHKDEFLITNTSSQKYLIKYHDLVHSILPNRTSKLYHLFFYMLNIKISRPNLDQYVLRQLKNELKGDIDYFKNKVDMDFSSWKLYNNS